MNRLFDIIFILILIPLLLPLFLIVLVLAFIFHRKDIFFLQDRLGKNTRVFKLVKFRSMIVGAEKTGTGLYSYEDDTRITSFGKFLRTTSLDELPQIFNIIIGNMSFVGPRPAVVGELEAETDLPKNTKDRFLVKPGLTGWAQIHGRDDLAWREKVIYDLEFVHAKPLTRMFMTVYVVVFTPLYLLKFSSTYEKRK